MTMYNPEHPLKRLSEYERAPAQPAWAASAVLFLTAATMLASMPLPWHHKTIPGDGYTILYGYAGASWLFVMAAIAAGFGIRLARASPGGYTKSLLTILAFSVFLAMFADYIDSQGRAAHDFADPFFGSGFFVGLGATGMLIIASVLTWRART